MKRLIWSSVLGIGLLAVSQTRVLAQSCFTFTDDYGTYTSISYDGTNIYTSVTVDGSGSMNITGGQGCSGINYSSAQHIPQAVNIIAAPGGSPYVGGEQAGTGECPDCYVSTTNNQSIAASSSGDYQFTWDGSVDCTFAGAIYGTGGFNLIGIHHATYEFASFLNGSECSYNQNCPNGNSAAVCGVGTVYAHTAQDCTFSYMIDRRITIDGTCFPVGSAYMSNSPVNCD